MRLPITPANTLLRTLRAQLREEFPAGRILVAVDGPARVPTAGFADAFAQVLGEDDTDVFRAHADDFLLPRADRRGDTRTPQWFDEETFRRVLVDPFRNARHTSAATGFQLRAWDARRNQPFEAKWVTAPDDAVLVVDGPSLHTPTLRGLWHFSVGLAASGEEPDESATAATVRVDVTDPVHPVLLGAGAS